MADVSGEQIVQLLIDRLDTSEYQVESIQAIPTKPGQVLAVVRFEGLDPTYYGAFSLADLANSN